MFTFLNKTQKDFRNIQHFLNTFVPYSQKVLKYDKPFKCVLVSDPKNASNELGKTAFYEPTKNLIVVYTDGRHPKDIMRSISHEIVHHAQNCRNEFDNPSIVGEEGYAQKDDHLRNMEKEAYLKGNMIFRDWEDGEKTMKKDNMEEMSSGAGGSAGGYAGPFGKEVEEGGDMELQKALDKANRVSKKKALEYHKAMFDKYRETGDREKIDFHKEILSRLMHDDYGQPDALDQAKRQARSSAPAQAPKMTLENENPCWDGYKMVGTKNKNGKEVPNCVPVNESSKDFYKEKQMTQTKVTQKAGDDWKEIHGPADAMRAEKPMKPGEAEEETDVSEEKNESKVLDYTVLDVKRQHKEKMIREKFGVKFDLTKLKKQE